MALDPQILALAKAIRQHETGNRPIAGATGELASRYQYLPSTWRATAAKYLGNPNAELTEENENKATYLKIKDWRDAGYNPGQIASMWNSGNPDMYAKGTRGVGYSSANPNVIFNVPKYVKNVYSLYEKFKSEQPVEVPEVVVPKAKADEPVEEKKTFFQPKVGDVRYRDVVREGWGVGKSVINYFKNKFQEATDEQTDLARREDEGEINRLAEFIGKAGIGAGTIVDVGYETVVQSIKGLGLLSEKISGTEGTGDLIKDKAIDAAIDFFNTETGKSVLEMAEAGEQVWNKFEENNPSLAEIVKGTARISELALLGGSKAGREAISTITKPAVRTIKTGAAITGEALEATGKKLLTGVEKQLLKEAENIVSPKITKSVKDLALKEGRISKTGEYTLTKFEKEVAEAASEYVKKSNTPQKNISNIMAEISRESEELAKVLKENDAIFNTNQLRARIKNSLKDVDDILIDEKRLNKAKDEIVETLIKEVETKKLSSLWEARKRFDDIIDSKINAFAGVSTIKKDISLAVRRAVNDFIVEKSPQLIKDGKHPFSDAMAKMRKLYVAEQNIANKVLPSQLNQATLGNLGRKLKSISHKVGAIQGGLAVVGIYSLGQALFNPIVIGGILAYGSYRVGKEIITSKALRKAVGFTLEKTGKLLNPEEKRHLQLLFNELNKAVKSEEGFQKIPGLMNRKQGGIYQTPEELAEIQKSKYKLDKNGDLILEKKSTNSLTSQIAKAKQGGMGFDDIIESQSKKYDNVGDFVKSKEYSELQNMSEELMSSAQKNLKNGFFTTEQASKDFKAGQDIRYYLSKKQKEAIEFEKSNRWLSQEKKDIELRKTDNTIDKLTNNDINFLTNQAKKHDTFEQFLGEIRGSATQYGKYQPELRKYVSPDSKRLNEISGFENDTITVYRGIDSAKGNKINTGDFVTMSYDDAAQYTGNGKVVSMKVKTKDLITEYPSEIVKGEDIYELIYYPSSREYVKITDTQLKQLWDSVK